MKPWMIEKMKREREEKERTSQIPLYLPFDHSWLTGSNNQDKKEEKGSTVVDYTL